MLANLRALFACLIDIILFRRGPESLPASANLLAIVVAVNIAVTFAAVTISPSPPDTLATQLIVAVFVMLLLFQVAFRLVHKRERFVQTATAFFATNTLFLPAVIPLFCILLPFIGKPAATAAQAPLAASLLATALGIWEFIVEVRIVRAAFEWHWVVAIGFICGQNLASAFIYLILFGAPPASA
jgi:hypothetical protein